MITAELGGGARLVQRKHAFHPIIAKKEKGSPSKLPAAGSLTCLKAERENEREGRRGGKRRPSAHVGQKQHVLWVQLALIHISLVLSLLIRQTQFIEEALLIGHPSKTHAESKLPAIDWLSLSCATHHFGHKAQAAWHKRWQTAGTELSGLCVCVRLCAFACLVGGGACVPARLSVCAGQCPQCSCDKDLGPCVSLNTAKGPLGSDFYTVKAAHVALHQHDCWDLSQRPVQARTPRSAAYLG